MIPATRAPRSPPVRNNRRASGPAGIGIYVHFPYCLRKCPYCDFLSVAAEPRAIPSAPYADAVAAELRRRRKDVQEMGVASVFFGGGTPSLWDPRDLSRVHRAILGANTEGVEVTIECNPTSLTKERAVALADGVATRISLGVQGLDAARLEFLGRWHDPQAALHALEIALDTGLEVNADFIFGVQGQSPEAAVAEVEQLASMGVHHLSAYALTIESGTLFGARARRGQLPLCPDEVVAESFVAIEETLNRRGFEHYEISNYARDGAYARHNLGYWRGADYLGIGCGAFGTVTLADGRVRYRNTPVPDRYATSAARWAETDPWKEGPLVSQIERLAPATSLTERLMLGLRLAEGVDLDEAAAELGTEVWTAERERAARRLMDLGRLERDGGYLRIPKSEWLFADGIIAQLL